MYQIFLIFLSSFVAVFLATTLFYECLCLISRFVSGMTARHRSIMFVMIGGIFIAHAIAILIYAIIYWVLIHYAGFVDLSGYIPDHFLTYLYFSATSYSSLGVGDVFPAEGLRFLTGVEAINGLILITWSAAFTYFSVQKMWEAHGMETKFNKETN
ncbi:MAG: ion transporter [Micavibrio sp.]|nr:ion transporter [Micavibrio sp.]|tara:strand:+ start:1420 stop:1887 length:468 start_codon:yes stop_codon:yes gene_type:complete